MQDITPQEKVLMQIIWNAGEQYLTAREIDMALLSLDGKERNLSSLMTVLAKLADKGYLDPVKKFRKSTYYVPIITEMEFKSHITKQFIDGLHNGDFASLVSALVDNEYYTQNDIEQLKLILEQKSEKK